MEKAGFTLAEGSENEEKESPMKTVFKFFKDAFRSYRKEFAAALILALFSAAYGIFIPLAAKHFIELVSDNNQWTLLLQGAGVFVGLYLLQTGMNVWFFRTLDRFGGKYMSHLSRKMEYKLQQGSLLEIRKKDESAIRNILFTDVINIFSVVGYHIPVVVSSAILIVSLLVFLFLYDASTALLIGLASAVGIVISILSKKYITNASKAVNMNMKEYDSCCTEFIKMLPMVQTNRLLGYYQEKTDGAISRFIASSRRADVPIYLWSGFSSGYYSVFSIVLSAVLVWPGAHKSVVDLVFFTLTAKIIIDESQKASQLIQQIIRNLPSFYHAEDILTLPKANGEHELPESVDTIELRDVTFSYAEKTEEVLRGISCEFRKGDVIRVRGSNGSGKSTFYKLLTGLYPPASGSLKMNGIPVQALSREALNRAVLYINQDENCLNETVRHYLQIISGKQIPDSSIQAWLNEVKLEDTDAVISGNGDSLSGGQRKKLYVLKLLATVDRASVIILDEIAAGMDQDTVAVLLQIVKRIAEAKDKIIFITDHGDPSNVWNSNLTFTLDHGLAKLAKSN